MQRTQAGGSPTDAECKNEHSDADCNMWCMKAICAQLTPKLHSQDGDEGSGDEGGGEGGDAAADQSLTL